MYKFIQKLYRAFKWKVIDENRIKFFAKRSFKGLKNKDFTIICNNCAAGFIYQDAKLGYLTPTVGLFFHSPCFMELLKDISLLNQPLQFIEASKYESTNALRDSVKTYYPIGVIGDGIEIHFLHYKTVEECKEKWQRRLKKINYSNVLFLYAAREMATDQHIVDFLNLPFKNKLCFSAKPFAGYDNLVYFPQYQKYGEMPGADVARLSVLKKVNFAEVFNNLKDSKYDFQ